jgi:transposase
MVSTKDLDLSGIETKELEERLRTGQLTSSDVEHLLRILALFSTLRQLLHKRSLGLLTLLRRMFGVKSEPHKHADNEGPRDKTKDGDAGHGRRGREGYPGAERVSIDHPELKPKQKCPECNKGRLYETEPAVDYSWVGNAPLNPTIYLLRRLLCPECKTSFTAPSPGKGLAHTVDDKQDQMKTGIVDANAGANAMVAGLRFEYGVPHYRLAKIQERRGMALPASNQDRMIKQVAFSAAPIHEALIRMAADGELLQSDDTRMKILRCLKNGQDPPLKKTQTTVIISHVQGKAITLHVTGTDQAGSNVSSILGSRTDGLPPPIHMCDGLSANNLSEEAIVANCLDHARRKFYDIQSSYKEEANYILTELQKVYLVDRKAKNLNAAERLKMHRKQSKPRMDALQQWMQLQIESRSVEPNSPLGKAIKYSLKRWPELTRFLEVPGVPLSNSETEQAIKWAICHRKNSLFYRTQNGARNGDIIQSIIKTCNSAGVNSFDYLVALQENRSRVYESPDRWLPWNYRANL